MQSMFIKSVLFFFTLFFFVLTGCAQKPEVKKSELNLSFENTKDNFPTGWLKMGQGDYKIFVDSAQSKKGKYAAVIESIGDSVNFNAICLGLPQNYKGDEITLKGWIKTENVREGFAGFWLRIDPGVGFYNMSDRGVKGTTDWQQYEIKLKLDPKNTTQIVLGGMLVGKGKVWLDGLEVFIDGKDITKENIDLYKSEIPADNDKEFNNGSKINLHQLSSEQVDNLALLGRIWGFMKYHHPTIAKGEYNWDYELFRILPNYLKVSNKQSRDNLLVEWIKRYGRVPKSNTSVSVSDKIFITSNLTWLDKEGLSKKLKDMLYHIHENRNQGDNYYISLVSGVGNPKFQNEKLYENMPYPDTGFRLLSLFKYWNMIEYFFPYKYLTDKKWDSILNEYIPILVKAKDELAYELAITQLIGDINDSHAYVSHGNDKIQLWRGPKVAPFEVKFIQNKLVVTDYYNTELCKKSNLKIGDIITSVRGKSVESIVDSLRPYYRASNEDAGRRAIAMDILRSPADQIDVSFISEGQEMRTNLHLFDFGSLRKDIWLEEKGKQPVFKILNNDIGYLSLENVKSVDVNNLKVALANLKGLIIDIRNYPNEFVALHLASLFVAKSTEFVKFSKGNINNPGEFRLVSEQIIQPAGYNYYDKNRKVFKGKVVVLLNEYTQSQAEFTAMALRAAPNTLIIGSNTSGADGNFSDIYLPGGIRTGISGIGVYYPDGRETQRVGIVPDIEVKPTVMGIRAGKDEVLLKAIDILK